MGSNKAAASYNSVDIKTTERWRQKEEDFGAISEAFNEGDEPHLGRTGVREQS